MSGTPSMFQPSFQPTFPQQPNFGSSPFTPQQPNFASEQPIQQGNSWGPSHPMMMFNPPPAPAAAANEQPIQQGNQPPPPPPPFNQPGFNVQPPFPQQHSFANSESRFGHDNPRAANINSNTSPSGFPHPNPMMFSPPSAAAAATASSENRFGVELVDTATGRKYRMDPKEGKPIWVGHNSPKVAYPWSVQMDPNTGLKYCHNCETDQCYWIGEDDAQVSYPYSVHIDPVTSMRYQFNCENNTSVWMTK